MVLKMTSPKDPASAQNPGNPDAEGAVDRIIDDLLPTDKVAETDPSAAQLEQESQAPPLGLKLVEKGPQGAEALEPPKAKIPPPPAQLAATLAQSQLIRKPTLESQSTPQSRAAKQKKVLQDFRSLREEMGAHHENLRWSLRMEENKNPSAALAGTLTGTRPKLQPDIFTGIHRLPKDMRASVLKTGPKQPPTTGTRKDPFKRPPEPEFEETDQSLLWDDHQVPGDTTYELESEGLGSMGSRDEPLQGRHDLYREEVEEEMEESQEEDEGDRRRPPPPVSPA